MGILRLSAGFDVAENIRDSTSTPDQARKRQQTRSKKNARPHEEPVSESDNASAPLHQRCPMLCLSVLVAAGVLPADTCSEEGLACSSLVVEAAIARLTKQQLSTINELLSYLDSAHDGVSQVSGESAAMHVHSQRSCGTVRQ